MLSRRSCPWERSKGRVGHGVNAMMRWWQEKKVRVRGSRSKMAGKGWVHGRAKRRKSSSKLVLHSLFRHSDGAGTLATSTIATDWSEPVNCISSTSLCNTLNVAYSLLRFSHLKGSPLHTYLCTYVSICLTIPLRRSLGACCADCFQWPINDQVVE